MQTGYVLIMSLEEIRGLSQATKTELSKLDVNFANMAGVPTEGTPTMPQGVQINGVNTLPAQRNQPNQISTVDPALQGTPMGLPPGMPNMPPGMPASVPSAAPAVTGIPPLPAPPQQSVIPPVQQQAPAAPPSNAGPMPSAVALQQQVLPKVLARFGHAPVMRALTAAHHQALIPALNVSLLTDEKVGAFVHLLGLETGTDPLSLT